MFKSIKQFAKLCVCRGNPADINDRTSTLVILFLTLSVLECATNFGMGWLSWINSSPGVQTIVADVFRVLGKICGHLFVALCLYVVLHFRSLPQNFRHAYSSYLGVCIIIALVSLMVIGATVLMSSPQDLAASFRRQNGYLIIGGTMFLVVSMVYLVSTVWKVLAFGCILYKSMKIKFWQAGIVAIMLVQAPEIFDAFAELIGFLVHAIEFSSQFGIF